MGAQLPRSGLRSPLPLSLSTDGLAWDAVYSLRDDSTLPPPRFHGFPGFQYPAGMVTAQGELLVVYSVNKEDIALTRLPVGSF